MSALPNQPISMTEEEYLAFERTNDTKHELIDKQVYAMTGASRRHNLIVGSTIATLYKPVREKGCEIYPSDMRVRMPATGSYAYPDISIVCSQVELQGDGGDILLNPMVIIEVLSPHTERYDRGRKFQLYRTIPSLQAYLLISQDEPHIEQFVRQVAGFWRFDEAAGLDTSLEITMLACQLSLATIYEQVDFAESDDD